MTTNSLAFRLFATAAAWTLLALPIAGAIIYSLYRPGGRDQLRPAPQPAAHRRLSTTPSITAISEPGDAQGRGRAAVRGHAFGLVLADQAARRQAGPPARRPARSPACPFRCRASTRSSPNEREVRWANLDGPLRAAACASPRPSTCSARARRRSATRLPSPARWARWKPACSNFRTRLTLALCAGRRRPAGRSPCSRSASASLPLAKVEKGLAAIRSGEATRLDVAACPQEIEPLQQELNALLKSNQDIVERARTHVGNLAHALKTPLAVITNEARDDPSPLARKVAEQAQIMADQVNLYLDRARMAARIGVIGRVTEVRPVSESIIRALERIYRDKQLAFLDGLPARRPLPGRAPGLWRRCWATCWTTPPSGRAPKVLPGGRLPAAARATAPAIGSRSASTTTGPGLTAEQMADPIIRGRRLDETKPGSGLGHSIVADLAHSYSGKLELARSEHGGLCARLTLPLGHLTGTHDPRPKTSVRRKSRTFARIGSRILRPRERVGRCRAPFGVRAAVQEPREDGRIAMKVCSLTVALAATLPAPPAVLTPATRTRGTVVGAIAGGVIGNQFGKGGGTRRQHACRRRGRRHRRQRDRPLARSARPRSSPARPSTTPGSAGQPGQPVRWRNPDNGRYGEVIPEAPLPARRRRLPRLRAPGLYRRPPAGHARHRLPQPRWDLEPRGGLDPTGDGPRA